MSGQHPAMIQDNSQGQLQGSQHRNFGNGAVNDLPRQLPGLTAAPNSFHLEEAQNMVGFMNMADMYDMDDIASDSGDTYSTSYMGHQGFQGHMPDTTTFQLQQPALVLYGHQNHPDPVQEQGLNGLLSSSNNVMPSFNNLEYPVDNYAAGVTENIGAISVDEASQIPRSTTPDIPVPSELSFSYTPFITQLPNINGPNVVRGGYTEKLANACSIPLGVPQEVFEQRCADIMATLASNTANVLPLPSPKVKHIPDPGVPSEAYKIRQKPARIRITPLLPKQKVEHYKPVQDLPEGPEKEAAKEYNNKVSKARSGRDKARNNEAANRTRDRKKRAMVYRAEALAKKRAESNFWKARAIGLGAGVNDWENLDGVVKREMVADQRFDPFDFVNDELIEAAEGFQEEQQQQQQQEIVQVGKKAQKGKKRKATEME